MPPDRRLIPPGQEELLRRMLDPPEGLPGGWQFVQAALADGGVEARYRLGGDVAVVRLLPAEAAGEDALRAGSFAIDSARRLPLELLSALEVSVLAREHRIRWSLPAPVEVDPGWCALEAGVARAIRRVAQPVDREQLAASERACRARGLCVVQLEREGGGAVLYAAKSCADAEWVRDAEQQLWRAPEHGSQRRSRLEELGWALGHPSCCVEASAARELPTLVGIAGSLLSGRFGSAEYRAARAAWVSCPEPRLNPFHRHQRRWLLEFEPCRYDCARALDWAARVAAACSALDPEWLEETDRLLAEPIVIAPSGALSRVAIERRIEPMRIIGAHALGSDTAEARQLLGAQARDDGLLVGDAIGWSLLVDFGRPRPG
jgi:hypothetical protein